MSLTDPENMMKVRAFCAYELKLALEAWHEAEHKANMRQALSENGMTERASEIEVPPLLGRTGTPGRGHGESVPEWAERFSAGIFEWLKGV